MEGRILLTFFLYFQFAFSATEDYQATSTTTSDVCELDNSCNSNSSQPETETDGEKSANTSEKWKYNISDGSTSNDSTVSVYRINETNNTINLELDELNATFSRSKLKNETKSTNTKFQIQLEEHCFCDLNKGSCDLNCCCDRDCLHVNRDIFQACNESQKSTENVICPSKILNSPLLCVVRDNLYSRHFYEKQGPFEKIAVEKLLKNRNVFSWSFPSLPNDTTDDSEPPKKLEVYAIGSPVWILTNDSKLEKFRLPKSTLTSRDCDDTEPIHFLENQEVICTHRVKNTLKFECEDRNSIFNAARYFANFSFIVNPNLTNLSSLQNNSHNSASIKAFTCEDHDLDTCTPINATISPILNGSVCSRAVTDVYYKIIHNGTEGIQSVELYLQLSTVVLAPDLLWSITFQLTHQWVNQASHFALSGDPGYAFGKPVITGHGGFKKRTQNKTGNSIEMSSDKGRWLTYFGIKMDGECSKMRRNNILFLENVYTHCFVPVPKLKTVEQCEIFQNEIYKIIFGKHTNISNVYVSSLGHPDVMNINKWTPFVLELVSSIVNESCGGIVTSVRILVLHALVGEHDNPQRSIIGVKVVGNTFDRSVQKREKLKISMSVNFFDVTNPPLRIFAEPPTYEVKLPTDFFYPFFSKGSKLVDSAYVVTGLLLLSRI